MILNKNIASILSVILLFLALIEGWPYGYFTLLRLVVFGTTAYLSRLAYTSERRVWTWLFGFIAIVFNPLIPLHLGRHIWVIVDLSVAIFLIISIFAFKLSKDLRMSGKEIVVPEESDQWYFAADGRTKEGPVSKETLLSLKSSGRVTDDTLIWSPGMKVWKPLSGVFAVIPPPFPIEALEQESKPDIESVSSANLFISHENNQLGPFSGEQVREMLDSGTISGSDLAWREGMTDWIPLQSLPSLPKAKQFSDVTKPIAESIPKQSVEEPNDSDVKSGAQWAKWLGIAKMAIGVFLLWVMASGDVSFGNRTALDAVWAIAIGAISFSLGLKLLNPDKRKARQFLTLIIIYGVALFLHVIAWASRVAAGEPAPHQIIPILTALALWKFIKGRRELKKIEEISVVEESSKGFTESNKELELDSASAKNIVNMKEPNKLLVMENKSPQSPKKRILVVDDEENIRMLYQEELQGEGYDVETASDGIEALEMLANKGPFDLVTTCIRMPRMDGINLVRKIKEKYLNTPVIIVTSYSGYKEDFNTWRADAYIVKSHDLAELKDTIKKILSPETDFVNKLPKNTSIDVALPIMCVTNEYLWRDYLLDLDKSLKFKMQKLMENNGRVYDVLCFEKPTSEEVNLYFDISSFYGKDGDVFVPLPSFLNIPPHSTPFKLNNLCPPEKWLTDIVADKDIDIIFKQYSSEMISMYVVLWRNQETIEITPIRAYDKVTGIPILHSYNFWSLMLVHQLQHVLDNHQVETTETDVKADYYKPLNGIECIRFKPLPNFNFSNDLINYTFFTHRPKAFERNAEVSAFGASLRLGFSRGLFTLHEVEQSIIQTEVDINIRKMFIDMANFAFMEVQIGKESISLG